MNKDNFFLGVLAGLIVPLLGIVMVYVLQYMPKGIEPDSFIKVLGSENRIASNVISLGLIACIPLISYYNQRKRMRTLKGIFLSIVFFGFLAVGFKFNLF